MSLNIQVRNAERGDCSQILGLLEELAIFEKMPTEVKITAEDLERDGFDVSPPLYRAMVAVDGDKVVGYVLFFPVYSTWTGKCLHLEDIYVTADYRSQKVGHLLFKTVCKVAVEENCSRVEFMVLKWNPACHFYQNHGAIDLTETENWHYYRVTGDNLQKLANE